MTSCPYASEMSQFILHVFFYEKLVNKKLVLRWPKFKEL